MFFFFFSSRRRHTRLQGDWSSDVCSSDLCVRREKSCAAARGPMDSFPFEPTPAPSSPSPLRTRRGTSPALLRDQSPLTPPFLLSGSARVLVTRVFHYTWSKFLIVVTPSKI